MLEACLPPKPYQCFDLRIIKLMGTNTENKSREPPEHAKRILYQDLLRTNLNSQLKKCINILIFIHNHMIDLLESHGGVGIGQKRDGFKETMYLIFFNTKDCLHGVWNIFRNIRVLYTLL